MKRLTIVGNDIIFDSQIIGKLIIPEGTTARYKAEQAILQNTENNSEYFYDRENVRRDTY